MSRFSSRLGLAEWLFLGLAMIALVLAAAGYRTERKFLNPVAYTLADGKLYILEKEKNSLLELSCSSTGGTLEAVGEDSQARKSLPIGIMEDALYTDGSFRLSPSETLVLYSDGITESFNSEGELFSEARLAQTIQDCCSHDPRALCLKVLEQVRIHQGAAQQADDITILSFRLSGSGMS